MDLTHISKEELEEELAKRAKAKKEAMFPPIANPDLTSLIKTCQANINEMLADEEDTDTEHYIYEEAMQAIFGKDVFNRIREAKKK